MPTKTKTPATADIRDLYLRFRSLEVEHATLSAIDASRGDLGMRGELTKRRDAALAELRAAADAELRAQGPDSRLTTTDPAA